MDHSDPPSTGSSVGASRSSRSKAPSADFRLQPDFNWTRSLSERVRGMRDSALGVVWKRRREQKLREIEARDACQWLLAAGFPQYVQFYEELKCPIDMEQVQADHIDELGDIYLQPVLRRIKLLNVMGGQKSDTAVHVKITDSEDCDRYIALSDHWIFRHVSSPSPACRWTHRQLTDDKVATDWSLCVDGCPADHRRRPGDSGSKDSCISDTSPSLSRRIAAATRYCRDSSRSPSRTSDIQNDPASCGDDESSSRDRHRRRHRRDVNRDRSPRPFGRSPGGSTDGTGSDELQRSNQDRFTLRGARSVLRRGVEGLIGRRSASSSSYKRKHINCRPEIGDPVAVTSSALENKMEQLGCVDVTSAGETNCNRSKSSDSLIGVLRNALLSTEGTDSGISSPDRSHQNNKVDTSCRSRDTKDNRVRCEDRGVAGWERYFDVCYCDPVDASSSDIGWRGGGQTQLDLILDELNKNISLLDQTLNSSDDTICPGSSKLCPDDDEIEWQYKNGLDLRPVVTSLADTRVEFDESIESTELAERRDSGVGISLSRPPRMSRGTVPSTNNMTPNDSRRHFNQMTIPELVILRKLCLLHVTSLMETFSPLYQPGCNWSMPKLPTDGERQSRHRNVFGAALGWSICSRRRGLAFPPGLLPLPLSILDAMNWLTRSASDAVGIFRKSGVRSRIQKLRDDIETFPDYNEDDLENVPVYDVADMLKLYFHELPDCLLTDQLSETCINIFTHVPVECRMAALQSTLALLPDENRNALHCLLLFLNRLADYSTENQMSASNLSICFAPSLFHVYGMRSSSPGNGASSVSPRRDARPAGSGSGLPDHKELVNQKAAHECLTCMITNVHRLFTMPEDMEAVHQLLTSRLIQHQGDQVTVDEDASKCYIIADKSIQDILKESQETASAGWLPVRSIPDDVIELSYRMCTGDDVTLSIPPRVWRCVVEVEGVEPQQVLTMLLHQRHLWDDQVTRWRVVQQLDKQTDVFHYVTSCDAIMPTARPLVDYCELRSWRTQVHGNCCLLVSFSVQHPSVQPLASCVRGRVFSSQFFIEPRGSNVCRLTYISRADLIGHSVEWYRKFYGHVCAYRLGRICDSLRSTTHAQNTRNNSSTQRDIEHVDH